MNTFQTINFKKGGQIVYDDDTIPITCQFNSIDYDFKIKLEQNIIQEEFYFPLFPNNTNRSVFIIAVYEKDITAKNNIEYFIKHGMNLKMDYLFVLNNEITFEREIPVANNVHIIKRANLGYDFGAYSLGIQLLKHKTYDYYFFMNSSTKGPFIPSYVTEQFDTIFINLFKNNVHLVSPTIINLMPTCRYINPGVLPAYKKKCYPICQSWMFVIDQTALGLLNQHHLFDYYYATDFFHVMHTKECLLSMLMLHHGYNIACLMPEYQDIDFTSCDVTNYPIEKGYNPMAPNQMFHRTLHPYESIFHKNNIGSNLSVDAVKSLTNADVINDSLK